MAAKVPGRVRIAGMASSYKELLHAEYDQDIACLCSASMAATLLAVTCDVSHVASIV
jgi:hypothetical protein